MLHCKEVINHGDIQLRNLSEPERSSINYVFESLKFVNLRLEGMSLVRTSVVREFKKDFE